MNTQLSFGAEWIWTAEERQTLDLARKENRDRICRNNASSPSSVLSPLFQADFGVVEPLILSWPVKSNESLTEMSSTITRDKKKSCLVHSLILFGYLIPTLRDPEGRWLLQLEEAIGEGWWRIRNTTPGLPFSSK